MFASLKAPDALAVSITTSSPEITPTKAAFDGLIVADVVPLYPRFEAVIPDTVSVFAVMLADVDGWVMV